MAMHTISIGKEIKKEVCSIKMAPANSLGIVLKHSYVTASLHLYQIMIVYSLSTATTALHIPLLNSSLNEDTLKQLLLLIQL